MFLAALPSPPYHHLPLRYAFSFLLRHNSTLVWRTSCCLDCSSEWVRLIRASLLPQTLTFLQVSRCFITRKSSFADSYRMKQPGKPHVKQLGKSNMWLFFSILLNLECSGSSDLALSLCELACIYLVLFTERGCENNRTIMSQVVRAGVEFLCKRLTCCKSVAHLATHVMAWYFSVMGNPWIM